MVFSVIKYFFAFHHFLSLYFHVFCIVIALSSAVRFRVNADFDHGANTRLSAFSEFLEIGQISLFEVAICRACPWWLLNILWLVYSSNFSYRVWRLYQKLVVLQNLIDVILQRVVEWVNSSLCPLFWRARILKWSWKRNFSSFYQVDAEPFNIGLWTWTALGPRSSL